jgi:hypothetical protein
MARYFSLVFRVISANMSPASILLRHEQPFSHTNASKGFGLMVKIIRPFSVITFK